MHLCSSCGSGACSPSRRGRALRGRQRRLHVSRHLCHNPLCRLQGRAERSLGACGRGVALRVAGRCHVTAIWYRSGRIKRSGGRAREALLLRPARAELTRQRWRCGRAGGCGARRRRGALQVRRQRRVLRQRRGRQLRRPLHRRARRRRQRGALRGRRLRHPRALLLRRKAHALAHAAHRLEASAQHLDAARHRIPGVSARSARDGERERPGAAAAALAAEGDGRGRVCGV